MTTRRKSTAAFLAMFAVPQQAAAFSFGFVQVPDYVDLPVYVALAAMILSFTALKLLLPRGQRYTEIPEEDKSTALAMAAYLSLVSTIVLLALVIVGVGLHSFADA